MHERELSGSLKVCGALFVLFSLYGDVRLLAIVRILVLLDNVNLRDSLLSDCF